VLTYFIVQNTHAPLCSSTGVTGPVLYAVGGGMNKSENAPYRAAWPGPEIACTVASPALAMGPQYSKDLARSRLKWRRYQSIELGSG
jgi:hypothetical protein